MLRKYRFIEVFLVFFSLLNCSTLLCSKSTTGKNLSPDPFDKNAVTTSLKDAYPTARWVENFDRYIKTYGKVKSLKELSNGCSNIELKSYCLKPGLPVNNSNTYSYVLGPLKGTKAELIKEIFKRSAKHPEIEQKYVQTLLWGIIAGLSYSDYPDDVAKKIAPLLPDDEKQKSSKFKVKDLLNLPLPKDVKDHLSIVSDIRKLILEGINRYEDLERIAVPSGNPVPSKSDLKIDENCWTLMEGGFYVRPKTQGYPRTTLDVYKPEDVNITYDGKGRIASLSSVTGLLEFEYDENPGADLITYPKESHKINRISGVKLDGESIGKMWNILWYSPMDNKTSETSTYKRKVVGINVDPLEETFRNRDIRIRGLMDYLSKFNKGKNPVIGTALEKEIYELKQIEYCMKFVLDTLRFQVKEESIEKIIRIATDAAVNRFTSAVVEIYPKGGGGKVCSVLDMGGMVAVPGNNAQRIGISGEGTEEGNDEPPISTEGDPPPPHHDSTHTPDCTVKIKQVDRTLLPAPGRLFAVSLKIECERTVKEIEWILYDVSKEQGRCLNDKDPAFYKTEPDWDLSIMAEDNPGYTITQDSYAIIAEGREGASRTIYVRAHDYGAFGKLSARISVRSGFIEAVSEETAGSYVCIPKDLNSNNISDKWEEDNNVIGAAPNSDDDEQPLNQANTGDGMSLYEEYRGFYELLPEGTPSHIRMDPHKKEIFAIDDNFLLSPYSWEHASGIPVYRLNENLVYGNNCGGDMAANREYRRVNFCRNSTNGGEKYAVNLVKINGLDDPYNLCGPDSDTNYTGCSYIGPPINANLTIVLPDRIRHFFESIRRELQRLYDLIPEPHDPELHYSLGTLDLDEGTMVTYLNILNNPRKFNMIVDFLIKQNAIHETGHACGIKHHNIVNSGDVYCPMRYMNYLEEPMIFDAFYSELFSALYHDDTELIIAEGRWHFCRSGDNCWGKLNVNDWRH